MLTETKSGDECCSELCRPQFYTQARYMKLIEPTQQLPMPTVQ